MKKTWPGPLPLWDSVIFVDWHGVLSDRLFWSSIDSHPSLNSTSFRDRLRELFASDVPDSWMRGELDTESVLKGHLLRGSDERLVDILHEKVIDECRGFAMRRRLVKLLLQARRHSMVVLATDNMDCFTEAIDSRKDVRRVFDDYISSNDVGALKAEPERFFSPWLQTFGVTADRAILIDDNEENCNAFRSLGGAALFFDGSKQCWQQIEAITIYGRSVISS